MTLSNWLTNVWSGQDASTSSDSPRAAAAPPLRCGDYKIEVGFDYKGSDIGTGPSTANDDAACCELCERTAECNAFTFVLATRECWLKARRRGALPETQPGTLVSGYRPQLKRARAHLTRFTGGAGGGQMRTLVTPRRPRGAAGSARGGVGGANRAAFLRLQQERQVALLLERAAPQWQEARDERPLLRLSLRALCSVYPHTQAALARHVPASLRAHGAGTAATSGATSGAASGLPRAV